MLSIGVQSCSSCSSYARLHTAQVMKWGISFVVLWQEREGQEMPLQCNRRLQTILLHKKRSHLSVIRYYWLIYVRSKYKFVLCNISLKQQGLLVIVVALYCSWERRAWATWATFKQLSSQDRVSKARLIKWCHQIFNTTWFSPFVAMESALWHLSACTMPTTKLGRWARRANR